MAKNFLLRNAIITYFVFGIFKETVGYWETVWEDNFDGGNLEDRWTFDEGCHGWGNQELQCYTRNRRQNARQENGMLIIQARRENWRDREFTSARLKTQYKASWTYGHFEMRARLPDGKALWPAFWMMPETDSFGEYPRSGEIDIMEYKGQHHHNIAGNLHFWKWHPEWNSGHDLISTENQQFDNINFARSFNTFGLTWSRHWMVWYLNGQEFFKTPIDKRFSDFYSRDGEPFTRPFYILINMAVNGSYFNNQPPPFVPEDANGWVKPTYEIDYVRVFKWVE